MEEWALGKGAMYEGDGGAGNRAKSLTYIVGSQYPKMEKSRRSKISLILKSMEVNIKTLILS